MRPWDNIETNQIWFYSRGRLTKSIFSPSSFPFVLFLTLIYSCLADWTFKILTDQTESQVPNKSPFLDWSCH